MWDAWELDDRYEEQVAGEAELLEKQVVLQGKTKDVLRFRWRIHQSEMTQDVIFYHHERRIDFKTHVSWNEAHKLLKVGFPIDVVTDKATYEIPLVLWSGRLIGIRAGSRRSMKCVDTDLRMFPSTGME